MNLQEVYEKYKHADKFLSDPLNDGQIYSTARDLWSAIKEAVEHRVHPTGGTHSQIISMVNSLGNIVIDAASKGYVSSNDLDYANDCLDKVIPLLKPTSG